MNLKQILAGISLFAVAIAAYAGEKVHEKMVVEMIHSDGDQSSHFSFDSDDLGFDLMDMQVGENRSFVDKNGRTVLMTREEKGFSINIDGEDMDIMLPALGDLHNQAVWVGDIDGADVSIDVQSDQFVFRSEGDAGTVIITDKEVDDGTRQAIESLLQSAGHEGEVRFVDGAAKPHKAHGVHVVRKKKQL